MHFAASWRAPLSPSPHALLEKGGGKSWYPRGCVTLGGLHGYFYRSRVLVSKLNLRKIFVTSKIFVKSINLYTKILVIGTIFLQSRFFLKSRFFCNIFGLGHICAMYFCRLSAIRMTQSVFFLSEEQYWFDYNMIKCVELSFNKFIEFWWYFIYSNIICYIYDFYSPGKAMHEMVEVIQNLVY